MSEKRLRKNSKVHRVVVTVINRSVEVCIQLSVESRVRRWSTERGCLAASALHEGADRGRGRQ